MIRCTECGSWGVACASDTPVPDCGCARCLRAALAAEREAHERTTLQLQLERHNVDMHREVETALDAALARAEALLARCHRRVKAEHHPDCDVLKGYDGGCSLECEDRGLLDDLAAHLRDREGGAA